MTTCCISCEECYEYLELNKWHPFESTSKESKGLVSVANLSAAARRGDLDAFPELVTTFVAFVERHSRHPLRLRFSDGDSPWWPNEPNWYMWKRAIGPFFRPSPNQSDIDLPRNIIDDLGITDWSTALAHYRSTCPCVEHPEDLMAVFLSFVAAKAQQVGQVRAHCAPDS